MAEKRTQFDFLYAINNTEIVSLPTRQLETFGATILNYHLISELMDKVDHVRVREGKIQSYRPQIVIPGSSAYQSMLEGFGSEAEKYVEWLKDQNVQLLQYGFMIKKGDCTEQILADNVLAVTERVQADVKGRNDPFSAIVRGVDDPWEVCLLKLVFEVMVNSVRGNVRELRRRNLFGETDGIPNVVVQEIEEAFLAAARNPALVSRLARKLERYGIFEKYQDRFFSVVKHGDNNQGLL
ncbi:MAG: hypothetical protein WCN95_06440 [bacterium]